MPGLTQTLGGLMVIGALALAAHEAWLHTHPQSQGFAVTQRRLRRRLTGVVLILTLVGLLTWAGRMGDGPASARLKLALYGLAVLCIPILFGLALADVRETGRQAIRDQLDLDPATARALEQNPEVRALMERLRAGRLSEGDLAEFQRRVEESRAPTEQGD